MKKFYNFAVGPVTMDEEILKIGIEQIPYFRTEYFSFLMKENEKLVLKALNAPNNSRVAFITGSGTASMEATIANIFNSKDKVLIVKGGSFGARFSQLCDIYNISHTDINLEMGHNLTEQDLQYFENKGYTGFLVNINETSTGVLYNKELITEFCKRNKLKLVVDAISSFLADEFDMSKMGAVAVIAGSQKAMALPPGISFVALNEEGINIVKENKKNGFVKTLYFDLENALLNGERGQTPFTPAVSILIQLNKQFKKLNKEGFDKIIERTKNIATDFRNRIKNFPFRITSQSLSNAVTPLSPLNKNVSAHKIFEILKNEYNIFICPNGGDYKDILFRVGHMGCLTIKDNDALFEALKDLVKRKII